MHITDKDRINFIENEHLDVNHFHENGNGFIWLVSGWTGKKITGKSLREAIDNTLKNIYQENEKCKWTKEKSHANDRYICMTGCENAFFLNDGNVEYNSFNYCPYCGNEIERGS